ncbi:hypothetical protein PC116_g7602 [Phytophthora cactorum]|nr:hypothetical protein PC116_g7602 [Phytophthora cactorum]
MESTRSCVRYTKLPPVSTNTQRENIESLTKRHFCRFFVRTLLDPHQKEPQQVQPLMKQLRALAQAANLRLKTTLRLKLRRQTRWGRRTPYWLAILSCISADDEELDDLMLSPAANRRLKALLAEMGDIESISTKLQSEELNLLGARDLLELPAGDQAKFTNYLAPSVDIAEKVALRPFQCMISRRNIQEAEPTNLGDPSYALPCGKTV